MEAEVWVGCPGRWANFDELEDSLSIDELQLILNTIRDSREREQRFLAAINNIQLPNPHQEKMEEIKARAAARLRGEPVENYQDMSLEDLGIAVIRE